eukprot:TRINITY_DN1825_c0_g1_i1.p1 TRINITY_DN1825_c0_g1~~TRINITY_DN1825_c0_g1_i1.p1  ORF type:complete len:209 (-),score=48.46 TRINITY_DN1825_c0_g1_i1:162-722(-)
MKRLKRLEECNNAFNLELRELPTSEASKYHPKIKEYEQAYNGFKAQLEEMKRTTDRQRLGLDDTDQKKPPKTEDDILSDASKIQDKSKSVVVGMIDRINQTEQIGVKTISTIEKDNATLQGVVSDFGEIDDGLEQSRKLIRSIMMTFQRDKCLKTLCFFVLAGILIVLIWSLVDPNFRVGSPPTSS